MAYPAENKETDPELNDEFKTVSQDVDPELNLATAHNQLERGLKSRHIQFLALGRYPPVSSN